MSNTVIKVENLSKIYRLGEIGLGSISQDVDRWFKTKVMGKEDPFLKIGETNDRANKGNSDIVYSLRDINFEIQQGDAVGIIGRNGAGKSTLLKILSRVTTPTIGKINIKGRVASLLEVGTGFHPELTGRENIYLNGAILGMRRREIDRKLDEIIDFSGVERYIDTPVKRYSSGMYVRLAFAVAAHLESEILIVDEVLAVGDADFQKKCLGKIGDVSKGEGRTVLFVSHNMGAIRQLCARALLLGHGEIEIEGDIDLVCNRYLTDNKTIEGLIDLKNIIASLKPDSAIKILDLRFFQKNNLVLNDITNGDNLEIKVSYEVLEDTYKLRIYIDILDSDGDLIMRSFHDELHDGDLLVKKGFYTSTLTIPQNLLGPSNYEIVIGATIHKIRTCWEGNSVRLRINVINTGNYNRSYPDDTFRGKLGMSLNWQTEGHIN
jgi:lipopolysaccharide transport system ATP-binding protein